MGYLGILVFIIIALLFFTLLEKSEYKLALYICMVLAIFLRLWISTDPYLNVFDERYHALVSKNILIYFTPYLYPNLVISFDPLDWTHSSIWLHKPPLPFMIIALSLKVFGFKYFAVRLPSIILSTLSCVLTYKISSHFYCKKIALVALFLHAIHGLSIELVGGRVSSDHTDVFYLFFAQLAIYVAIVRSKSVMSILLTAFILMCAYLSKWIAVFIPIVLVSLYYLINNISRSKHVLLYVLTVIILGSSHLVIATNYPEELSNLYRGIFGLLKSDKSPHDGGYLYYINRIRIIYGELIYIPLSLIIVSLISRKLNRDRLYIMLWILVSITILSFFNAKRATYTLIFAPAMFILTAVYYYQFRYLFLNSFAIKRTYYGLTMILLLALPIRYSIERMKYFNSYPSDRIESKSIEVINNICEFDFNHTILIDEEFYIEFMFLHPITAYNIPLDKHQIDSLNRLGYTIVKRTNQNLVKVE